MKRILISFIVASLSFSVSAASDDAKQWEEANQFFKQVQELRDRYKVWGAIAYSLRTMPHGKDAIITSIFLNQTDQQKMEKMALEDCEARNLGSKCVVISFPGCLYAAVGRASGKEPGSTRTVWGMAWGTSAVAKLTKSCADQGFICSPPIGGCNYTDENYQNGFLISENPIPESKSTDWISTSR